LNMKYGHFQALHDIDLTIQPGIFGLLGPNGAGKSTLMRILTTLHTAHSGSIRYDNINWEHKHAVRKIIGYLPQKFSLYKHIKVKEALSHLATLKGLTENRDELVQKAIAQVNLLDVQDKRIGQLSGGMIRRVGIAQAILGNPRIIIVDEPTAGLDPEERIRLRVILQTLSSSSIVIISSHIVEDIETICEKAAIMYKGKILETGSIEDLKQTANGVIWSIVLEKEQFLTSQDQFKVIHQQTQNGKVKIRVMSHGAPTETALQEEPSLEDAYFHFMQKVER